MYLEIGTLVPFPSVPPPIHFVTIEIYFQI